MSNSELLFKFGRYEFELRILERPVIYLKNKASGQIVPLMMEGTFHRDGMVLGSAGYTDPEGSFSAEFEETEDCYYGHQTENYRFIAQRRAYPKSEWECVLKPGDQIMLIHIPEGADITAEYVLQAIHDVRPYIRKHYPGWDPVALHSGSWLLNPILADIVGKESKIMRFCELFNSYPVLSPGTAVFSFVFKMKLENNQVLPSREVMESLPENTRLERGLKKLYLDGKTVLTFNGAIFWDKDEK